MEALSRVLAPNGEPIRPDEFFDVADPDLAARLNAAAIGRTFDAAVGLGPVDLNINVMPICMEHPLVADALSKSPLNVERVVVEITEQRQQRRLDELAGGIRHIKRLGYSVVIDDLRSTPHGLNTFTSLLPFGAMPDEIKLDDANLDGVYLSLYLVDMIREVRQDPGLPLLGMTVEYVGSLKVASAVSNVISSRGFDPSDFYAQGAAYGTFTTRQGLLLMHARTPASLVNNGVEIQGFHTLNLS